MKSDKIGCACGSRLARNCYLYACIPHPQILLSNSVSRQYKLGFTLGLFVLAAMLVWWWLSQAQNQEIVAQVLRWLKHHPLVYAVILAFATAVMFPPFILIILGGFLYGATQGVLISSLAYLIGSIASFYLGRYFGRAMVVRIAAQRPRINALNLAVERKGFLMVLLSRLALVLPYNLLNIVLGASRVSLKNYIVGTWVGTLPIIIINSILGETAPGLMQILRGEIKPAVGSYLVPGVGLVIIVLLIWVVRWSSRQLQQELAEQENQT